MLTEQRQRMVIEGKETLTEDGSDENDEATKYVTFKSGKMKLKTWSSRVLTNKT